MGRLSKHRKFKRVGEDAAALKMKGRLHDLAPTDEDQTEMPAKLRDLLQQKEKMKRLHKGPNKPRNDHADSEPAGKTTKSGSHAGEDGGQNGEGDAAPKISAKMKEISTMKLLPGERLRDFERRVDLAAADEVATAARKNTKTAQKRKAFLKQRDEKLKTHVATDDGPDFHKERIRFGEVASAPPQLSAAPRRAPTKDKATKLKSLLLLNSDSKPAAAAPAPVRVAMLQEERARAIAAYREMKKAR
eukprot:m.42335 g.42335  ORF g.42335 m.42335 type:complete len:246 (+) comp5717_c0_seq1:48-785(+)